MSYKLKGGNINWIYGTEGVGYVTMIGEALVKGPIPFPWIKRVCIPNRSKNRFADWLLYLLPEPETTIGVPEPFAGVVYPLFSSPRVPPH